LVIKQVNMNNWAC